MTAEKSVPAVAGVFGEDGGDGAPSLLSVRRVCHFYGEGEVRKQVLYDNDLDVGPGEIVIMTGPSGSGKTTLLTLIGGLRTVQQGAIRVLDRELAGLSTRGLVQVRKRIGFIFQAHNLFDSLTAVQNVRMGLELLPGHRSAAGKRASEMLTRLGLGDRLHYRPESLSGGQRQRVAIARALAHDPPLVLADEPTAALDEKSGREVVTLLQERAAESKVTSIIVTHDNRILDVADRIVRMVDGRISSNVLVKWQLEICEFLRKFPGFDKLTPAALADVAEKLTRRRYPAGAVVCRQGEEGDRLYLIRKGSVAVVRDDGTPQRRVVAAQGPGDLFGEMALLSGQPRSASVIARGPLDVLTLKRADFEAAVKASASFKDELSRIYFQRR